MTVSSEGVTLEAVQDGATDSVSSNGANANGTHADAKATPAAIDKVRLGCHKRSDLPIS